MEWSDEGIVLSARRHGETAAIVTLFTREHGRHAGLVRGGTSRKVAGMLQPGNQVSATWRARLEDHLGAYSCELAAPHAARFLDDPARLSALSAACALLELTLPERQVYTSLYAVLSHLLTHLDEPRWSEVYVRWELLLLAELGFGLDLGTCAATGTNDHLIYVSPRSGRAVSASAGEPYRGKLLALPAFLCETDPGESDASTDTTGSENRSPVLAAEKAPALGELRSGLLLTGYFLANHVLAPMDRALPLARGRLPDLLG